jgi:Trp operon repressor
MDQESIIDVVRKAAAENRLSCESARELAEELNVPVSEIGRICNVLKIKITACQLGCF